MDSAECFSLSIIHCPLSIIREEIRLLAGRKLLIADASVTIRKIVDLTFTDEGVQVSMAATGDEAVERLDAEDAPPDIVLAQASLPGQWDGYGLCEYIKSDWRFRHIPVLLLIGTFEPFNEAEARRVGANDVLTKPFQSIRDLVSRVGALVSGRAGEERQSDTPDAPGASEEARSTTGFEQTLEFDAPAPDESVAETDERTHVEDEQAAGEITDVSPADDRMIEATAAPGTETTGTSGAIGDSTIRMGSEPAFAQSSDEQSEIAPTPGGESETPVIADDEQPVLDEQPIFVTETERDEDILRRTEGDMTESEMNASRDPASYLSHTEEPFMSESETQSPSIIGEARENEATVESRDARAIDDDSTRRSAATDDALLDLGDIEPTAAANISEDGDSVLDLTGDDLPTAPAQTANASDETIEMPNPFGDEAHGATRATEADEISAPPVFAAAMPGMYEPSDVSTPGGASEASATTLPASNLSSGERGQIDLDQLSPAVIDMIARRAVEHLSARVVEEIAWEVVPQLAELMIKRRLEEEDSRGS